MPPQQKRPREVIDLTEEGDAPRAKNARGISGTRRALSNGLSTAHIRASQDSSQRLAYQQRDSFDDEPELLDLTQSDDGPPLQLYGTIENKIVGIRYYTGLVSPGEVVILRREPSNP